MSYLDLGAWDMVSSMRDPRAKRKEGLFGELVGAPEMQKLQCVRPGIDSPGRSSTSTSGFAEKLDVKDSTEFETLEMEGGSLTL